MPSNFSDLNVPQVAPYRQQFDVNKEISLLNQISNALNSTVRRSGGGGGGGSRLSPEEREAALARKEQEKADALARKEAEKAANLERRAAEKEAAAAAKDAERQAKIERESGDWYIDPRNGEQVWVMGRTADARRHNWDVISKQREEAAQQQSDQQLAELVAKDENLSEKLEKFRNPETSALTARDMVKGLRDDISEFARKNKLDPMTLFPKLMQPAMDALEQREKAIKDTSYLDVAWDSTRMSFNRLADSVLDVLDGDGAKSLERAQTRQEYEANVVNNNPALREREAERREDINIARRFINSPIIEQIATTGEMAGTMVPALVATGLLATGAGELGAALGLTGRTIMGLRTAGAMLGGAATNAGFPQTDLATQIAADVQEGKTTAAEAAKELDDAHFWSTAAGAGAGAVTFGFAHPIGNLVGRAAARYGLNLGGRGATAAAYRLARSNPTLGGMVPPSILARAAETDLKNAASRSYISRYLTSGLPAAASEGASINLMLNTATNAIYSNSTGRDRDLMENAGEAMLSGALPGTIFGFAMTPRRPQLPAKATVFKISGKDTQEAEAAAAPGESLMLALPPGTGNPPEAGPNHIVETPPPPEPPREPPQPVVLTSKSTDIPTDVGNDARNVWRSFWGRKQDAAGTERRVINALDNWTNATDKDLDDLQAIIQTRLNAKNRDKYFDANEVAAMEAANQRIDEIRGERAQAKAKAEYDEFLNNSPLPLVAKLANKANPYMADETHVSNVLSQASDNEIRHLRSFLDAAPGTRERDWVEQLINKRPAAERALLNEGFMQVRAWSDPNAQTTVPPTGNNFIAPTGPIPLGPSEPGGGAASGAAAPVVGDVQSGTPEPASLHPAGDSGGAANPGEVSATPAAAPGEQAAAGGAAAEGGGNAGAGTPSAGTNPETPATPGEPSAPAGVGVGGGGAVEAAPGSAAADTGTGGTGPEASQRPGSTGSTVAARPGLLASAHPKVAETINLLRKPPEGTRLQISQDPDTGTITLRLVPDVEAPAVGKTGEAEPAEATPPAAQDTSSGFETPTEIAADTGHINDVGAAPGVIERPTDSPAASVAGEGAENKGGTPPGDAPQDPKAPAEFVAGDAKGIVDNTGTTTPEPAPAAVAPMPAPQKPASLAGTIVAAAGGNPSPLKADAAAGLVPAKPAIATTPKKAVAPTAPGEIPKAKPVAVPTADPSKLPSDFKTEYDRIVKEIYDSANVPRFVAEGQAWDIVNSYLINGEATNDLPFQLQELRSWTFKGNRAAQGFLLGPKPSEIERAVSGNDVDRAEFRRTIADQLPEEPGPTDNEAVILPPHAYGNESDSITNYNASPESMKKWEDYTRKYMGKHGYTPEEIEQWIKDCRADFAIFDAVAHKLGEQLVSAGENPLTTKNTTGEYPGLVLGGPWRENADGIYQGSMDFTANCEKRTRCANTARMVEAMIGRPLNVDEAITIVALHRCAGREAPCIYCYVESKRRDANQAVDEGIWRIFEKPEMVPETRKVKQVGPDGKEVEVEVETGSGKRVPKKPDGFSDKRWKLLQDARKEALDHGITLETHLATDPKDRDIRYDFITDPKKAKAKETLDAWARLPKIYKYLESEQLSRKSNLVKLYEEYRGELLAMSPEKIQELNGYAGVRFFSSSDFQIEHFTDAVQAFYDMHIVGAKSHAYTKVPMYVELFGDTNQKINCSLFAHGVDKHGSADPRNWTFLQDTEQGWDHQKAFEACRNRPHVGTVLVSARDDIVLAGLHNPDIHYMIPFHFSGLMKKHYQAAGYQDFTSTQNESTIDAWVKVKDDGTKALTHSIPEGKAIRMHHMGTAEGISDAEGTKRYLELCRERRYYPVFPQFVFKDFMPVNDTGLSFEQVDNLRRKQIADAKKRWKDICDNAKSWDDYKDLVEPNFFKLKKDYARTDTPFEVVDHRKIDMQSGARLLKQMFETFEHYEDQYIGYQDIANDLRDLIRWKELNGPQMELDMGTMALLANRMNADVKSFIMGTPFAETSYLGRDALAAWMADKRGDVEYASAVYHGDWERACQMLADKAREKGFDPRLIENNRTFRLRVGPEPTQTKKVYKAFYINKANGRPTALFVGGADDLPTGVWLDAVDPYCFTAENGKMYTPSIRNPHSGKQTGSAIEIPNERVRQELIDLGYGDMISKDGKSIDCVAYRPGWHLSELPHFPQGGVDDYFSNPGTMIHEYNKVIFECEIPAKDLTDMVRAQEKARNKQGQIIQQKADLQQMLWEDGYYRYATNRQNWNDNNLWFIANTIKIVRPLTEEETQRILRREGREPQYWAAEIPEKVPNKKSGRLNDKYHRAPLDLESLGIRAKRDENGKPIREGGKIVYEPYDRDNEAKTLQPTWDQHGKLINLSDRMNPEVHDVRYNETASQTLEPSYSEQDNPAIVDDASAMNPARAARKNTPASSGVSDRNERILEAQSRNVDSMSPVQLHVWADRENFAAGLRGTHTTRANQRTNNIPQHLISTRAPADRGTLVHEIQHGLFYSMIRRWLHYVQDDPPYEHLKTTLDGLGIRLNGPAIYDKVVKMASSPVQKKKISDAFDAYTKETRAFQQVKADIDAICNWVGVNPENFIDAYKYNLIPRIHSQRIIDKMFENVHEHVARGYEEYVGEGGKAPRPELQPFYDRMSKWITTMTGRVIPMLEESWAWDKVTGWRHEMGKTRMRAVRIPGSETNHSYEIGLPTGVKLTNEIREVFRRMRGESLSEMTPKELAKARKQPISSRAEDINSINEWDAPAIDTLRRLSTEATAIQQDVNERMKLQIQKENAEMRRSPNAVVRMRGTILENMSSDSKKLQIPGSRKTLKLPSSMTYSGAPAFNSESVLEAVYKTILEEKGYLKPLEAFLSPEDRDFIKQVREHVLQGADNVNISDAEDRVLKQIAAVDELVPGLPNRPVRYNSIRKVKDMVTYLEYGDEGLYDTLTNAMGGIC